MKVTRHRHKAHFWRVACMCGALLAWLSLPFSLPAKTVVTVKKAGTLATLLTPGQQDTVTWLELKGSLNSKDLILLRRMAGYVVNGEKTGSLKKLDLKECRMKKSKEPFMVLDAAKERVIATAVPTVIDYNSKYVTVSFSNTYTNDIGDHGWPKIVVKEWAPVVLLDYVKDQSVSLMSYPRLGNSSFRVIKPYENEKTYFFRQGISDGDWAEMKKTGIASFRGHKFTREAKGVCRLYVYSSKGYFHMDTFYKCPHLEVLFLPDKDKLNVSASYESEGLQLLKAKMKKDTEWMDPSQLMDYYESRITWVDAE